MSLDNMLKFFVPQDNSFFPLFEGESRCTLQAARLLNDYIYKTSESERDQIYAQIKDLENESDSYTHKVYDRLNQSFLTPFDREDIQALASKIDDVLDLIYAVSQRLQWYKFPADKISEEFKNFVKVINKMAEEIQLAVSYLPNYLKNKDKIYQSCIVLNTLEEECDRIFYAYMSRLFELEDTKEIVKKKDIFQTIEKVADAAEDVSDILKTILIKNV